MTPVYRIAEFTDLPAIVALLADDALGRQREDLSEPLNESYNTAFNAIAADPNNELIVIDSGTAIIGLLQLTYIPYLTHTGSWRCLIEGVRVHSDWRGKGLGAALFDWAIERAKAKGVAMIQLTSDKSRPEAIQFYQRLGFIASHEGMKLKLP